MSIFDRFKSKEKKASQNTVSLTTLKDVRNNKDAIVRNASKQVANWVEKQFDLRSSAAGLKLVGFETVSEQESISEHNFKVIKKASLKYEVTHNYMPTFGKKVVAVAYNEGAKDEFVIKPVNEKKASAKSLGVTRKLIALNDSTMEFEILGEANEENMAKVRKAGFTFENKVVDEPEISGPVCEIFVYGKEKEIARKLFAQEVPQVGTPAGEQLQPQDVAPATEFDLNSAVLGTSLKISKIGEGDNWKVTITKGGSNVVNQALQGQNYTYFNLKKALIDAGLVDAASLLDANVTNYLTQKEIKEEQTEGTEGQLASVKPTEDIPNFPGSVKQPVAASKKKAQEEIIEEQQEPNETPEKNDIVEEAVNPQETPKTNDIVEETQEPSETPNSTEVGDAGVKDGKIVASEKVIEDNVKPAETPKENAVVENEQEPEKAPKTDALVEETQKPSEIPAESDDVIKDNTFNGSKVMIEASRKKIMAAWNKGEITDKEAVRRLAEAEAQYKSPSDNGDGKKDDYKGKVRETEMKLTDIPKESDTLVDSNVKPAETPKTNDLVKENEKPVKTPDNTDVITDGKSGPTPKDKVEASKKVNALRADEVNGNLVITVSPEEQKELAEMQQQDPANFVSDKALYEFFEKLIANTEFSWVTPEEIGALTDAPILGIKDNNGQVIKAWAYMNYMLESPLAELAKNGTVIFQNGDAGRTAQARLDIVAEKRFSALKNASKKRLAINTVGIPQDILTLLVAYNDAYSTTDPASLGVMKNRIKMQIDKKVKTGEMIEEKAQEINKILDEGGLF